MGTPYNSDAWFIDGHSIGSRTVAPGNSKIFDWLGFKRSAEALSFFSREFMLSIAR
jgi:hypothetical protein